jgi:hypothetical protein
VIFAPFQILLAEFTKTCIFGVREQYVGKFGPLQIKPCSSTFRDGKKDFYICYLLFHSFAGYTPMLIIVIVEMVVYFSVLLDEISGNIFLKCKHFFKLYVCMSL